MDPVGAARAPRREAGPVALAIVFVVVHVLLGWMNTMKLGNVSPSDTHVYLEWMQQWHATGRLVGISAPWVYPIGALPPMLFADVFGAAGFMAAWIVLVSVLNAVAMVFVARRSMRAAWWWLGCIALLGPLGLSHLDGLALPFVIVGVLAVERRPAVATVLFTVAAWIKVWPGAMVAALLIAGRRRLAVLVAAVATSALILAIAFAAGARHSLFSFIGAQSARGLQIEAPIASVWLIWGALGGPVRIFYDHGIRTFELHARGAHLAAVIMTPVLAVGVALVVVLAFVALARGRDRNEVLACTALGLVTALIALNKVGSPQYYDWFVAPVLLGLLSTGRFRTPAVLTLVISALTFIIYPLGYNGIIRFEPVMIGVLAVRNLLLVALFCWALWRLAFAGRAGGETAIPPDQAADEQASTAAAGQGSALPSAG